MKKRQCINLLTAVSFPYMCTGVGSVQEWPSSSVKGLIARWKALNVGNTGDGAHNLPGSIVQYMNNHSYMYMYTQAIPKSYQQDQHQTAKRPNNGYPPLDHRTLNKLPIGHSGVGVEAWLGYHTHVQCMSSEPSYKLPASIFPRKNYSMLTYCTLYGGLNTTKARGT